MNELVNGYSAGLIVAIAGLSALAFAHLIARIAIASGLLLDRPNERSSHASATPKSGGVAIIGGWLIGLAAVAAFSGWAAFGAPALAFAALVAAALLLGLADDAFNLNAGLKLLGQITAAILYVAVFGPLEAAPLPGAGLTPLGVFAAPVTIFWIVGFMNAFNFMDGVNGIAAACGAFALGALGVAAAFLGAPFWAVVSGLGAIALIAFLPMNSPKGRLFMGDNGSQAVGFLMAGAAVGAANASGGAVSALFLPVAMLPFLFDVAFTLAHRSVRGRNLVAAHREHLYQLLARLTRSHAVVTVVFLSLTALSTAAAFLMLGAPAGYQWAAPLMLAAAFAAPCRRLFGRARAEGLLGAAAASAEPQPAVAAAPVGLRSVERVRAHAAE